MATIAQGLHARDNALNLIRLCLAVLVITSHAFPISGLGDEPQLGDLKLGTLAVGGFFAISGFLITRSGENTSLSAYFWRRALRILPGFWVCLLVTAFLLAAVAGVFRGGWNAGGATYYVFSNFDLISGTNTVGETLKGAPFPGAWNGSLWTLRWELLCYAGVGCAMLMITVRTKRWPTLAAFAAVTIMSMIFGIVGSSSTVGEAFLLAPFFLAGAVLYKIRNHVPLDSRLAALSAIALTVVCLLGVGHSFAALPLSYFLIWLSATLPSWLRRLGSKNDYSYGMYLYAFPIQQLLIVAGAHNHGITLYVVASIVATAPLAVASWWAVEKPIQRLKSLVPNRSHRDNSPSELAPLR